MIYPEETYFSYQKAKTIVQRLKLKTSLQWKQYARSGAKLKDIPSDPSLVYGRTGEWKGWADWLGTAKNPEKKFLPYKEAQAFVETLKITNVKEWKLYCTSGDKPDTIPAYPPDVYQNTGEWQGWRSWFGKQNYVSFKLNFLPFEQARAFAHTLRLCSLYEWQQYCKFGDKPDNIPVWPDRIYSGKGGWKGWKNWLGNLHPNIIKRNIEKSIASQSNFLPFEQARTFVHTLNFKSEHDWLLYCRSGNKPTDIPDIPSIMYKHTGEWKDWNDWLGISADDSLLHFLPYQNARAFVHKLKLENQTKWDFYCKSGNIPQDIPIDPDTFYTETGEWTDWKDWLGV
ncbi:hypothetical protein QNI19_36015 [Cytophagaceae bacterium DM2B3-1]|uniref:Sulfatase-modifying factor enzyme domain-containing protein n=1 Tax=Xanthocytophaga flava TaxID=3048013 RepID=A0ABT7CZQ8_9BACT|nr:hypothetical protein [Xanthocytophaga flavus]MDJ1498397.1 hypothetical protein [Xanthocytophaga flavus]